MGLVYRDVLQCGSRDFKFKVGAERPRDHIPATWLAMMRERQARAAASASLAARFGRQTGPGSAGRDVSSLASV
ncbi:hypothetical protein K0M31_014012 [Melipona bicolor]|uniref:Uncharacterized protein n=1 Tax=Melipona bicolor TaxID=60889 RepID=A0AA40G7R5_9HYME|nr:hypothetical protein K0M31_014012 [Melipona bicolor]